ncbi:MAG TPA: hypothetical protein VF997_18475, partial [Polyangia bacterium]
MRQGIIEASKHRSRAKGWPEKEEGPRVAAEPLDGAMVDRPLRVAVRVGRVGVREDLVGVGPAVTV